MVDQAKFWTWVQLLQYLSLRFDYSFFTSWLQDQSSGLQFPQCMLTVWVQKLFHCTKVSFCAYPSTSVCYAGGTFMPKGIKDRVCYSRSLENLFSNVTSHQPSINPQGTLAIKKICRWKKWWDRQYRAKLNVYCKTLLFKLWTRDWHYLGGVGNAESQALSQNCWTRTCILPRSQAISLCIQVWRALAKGFRECRCHFQVWTQGFLGEGTLRREKILMMELVIRRVLSWAKAGGKKDGILGG